jgi:hypothetical protein
VRQNPDVILIGEMRDIETMNVALQASETGHLVFSTVHTSSAADTLDRIINLFPLHERATLCLRMSNSLRGVVSQMLLPRQDAEGRIAALEIMIATPTIAKLIEEGKAGNIYTAIQEGGFWGMQTMNQCLVKYFRAGLISEEDAMSAAGQRHRTQAADRPPASAWTGGAVSSVSGTGRARCPRSSRCATTCTAPRAERARGAHRARGQPGTARAWASPTRPASAARTAWSR